MINDNIMVNKIIPQLIKTDIPDDYRVIIDSIGIDNFMKLLELAGGTTLYFPKIEMMIRPARNRMIIKENKGNYRVLAQKYGITYNGIKKIVSSK